MRWVFIPDQTKEPLLPTIRESLSGIAEVSRERMREPRLSGLLLAAALFISSSSLMLIVKAYESVMRRKPKSFHNVIKLRDFRSRKD